MKELYKSPVLTVEELVKMDVLCASGEGGNTPGSGNEEAQVDNIVSVLTDMTLIL